MSPTAFLAPAANCFELARVAQELLAKSAVLASSPRPNFLCDDGISLCSSLRLAAAANTAPLQLGAVLVSSPFASLPSGLVLVFQPRAEPACVDDALALLCVNKGNISCAALR